MSLFLAYRNEGPVFDDDGKLERVNMGVSWFHILMILIFNCLYYVCYDRLITAVNMGVTPKWWLDAFGLNVLIQFLYCFFEWPLKLYWIIPLYGVYMIWSFVAPFLSGGGSSEPQQEEKKSNRQKKREAAEATGKPQ